MIFETTQLRTLVAIVETGSFTKAAGVVNLTQPAVSLHIKRLEDQLMRKIFERDGRRLVLTADGEVLVGFARRILALHSEAESAFEGIEIAGRVRLGAPEYFDSKVLAMLLAHFSQRHPGVELEVKIALGPEVRAAFEGGELDVAILNAEIGESDGPLLGHDNRIWVASADFTLAPDKPLPLVLFNNTCEWRRIATQLLDQHDISWTPIVSSGGVTGLIAGIEAGLGVSVFPQNGLPPFMREVGERYRLPTLPPFEYRLFQSRLTTAAARRLAFAIRDVFGHEEIRPTT
ncbi:MAG TPA: LysR family transcriptional regulator [Hyphomicrobium sp.]|jgi:DNA-binding transcriptional LysR family regulator|nr:LysR family transcriptional regulator [Hyphomicrobium sp.]